MLSWLLASGCPGFGDKDFTDFVDSDETPTWETSIREFMAAKCVECHQNPPQNDAPEGFRFDKYDRNEGDDGLLGAYELSQSIQILVVEEGTMPPDGPLTTEERALLSAWIAAGSPRDPSDLPRLHGALGSGRHARAHPSAPREASCVSR